MKKENDTDMGLFVNSLGYINEKKLFNFLYPSTKKVRVQADANVPAHVNLPCKSSSELDMAMSIIISRIYLLKEKKLVLFYIAYIQLTGALRISEVLAIKYTDISAIGHIRIHALKGSNDSIIHAGEARQFLLSCKKNCIDPFSLYSRFFVYREYKKAGIIFQSRNSSKASVTHAMRHIDAQSLRNISIENNNLQQFMRHKNPKNTEKYGSS